MEEIICSFKRLYENLNKLVTIKCKILYVGIAQFGTELIIVDTSAVKVQLLCFLHNSKDSKLFIIGNHLKISKVKVHLLYKDQQIYNACCLLLTNSSYIEKINDFIDFKDEFKSLNYLKFSNNRVNLSLTIVKVYQTEPFLSCRGIILMRRKILVTNGSEFWYIFLWKRQCLMILKMNQVVAFFACRKSNLLLHTIDSVGYCVVETKNRFRYKFLGNKFNVTCNLAWLKQVSGVGDVKRLVKSIDANATALSKFCLFCGCISKVFPQNMFYYRNYNATQIDYFVEIFIKDLWLENYQSLHWMTLHDRL